MLASRVQRSPASRPSNFPHVLALCDVLRLHAATLPPSAFLRSFLQSHEVWRKSASALRDASREANANKPTGPPNLNHADSLLANLNLSLDNPLALDGGDDDHLTPKDDRIDLGSPYAAALGFGDDVPWTPANPKLDDPRPVAVAPHKPNGSAGSRSRAKRKKKKPPKGSAASLALAALRV